MEQSRRNRAEGWKYAKLSGHDNELSVNRLIRGDPNCQSAFLLRTGYSDEKIIRSEIGGIHERNVPGVLGRTTKSKTDLKVFCESGRQINVSVKKSFGGQVYYVRAELFFQVFERQFQKEIPECVKRAIRLFWSAADDAVEIINQYGDQSKKNAFDLQIKHKSLNAETLKAYDLSLYNNMLLWFSENAYELVLLAFARGAASDANEWAEFVWYINAVGDNQLNAVFSIHDICKASAVVSERETCYGTQNGGTTIQLPFGFVEWHHGQMQFHHKYEKIKHLIGM